MHIIELLVLDNIEPLVHIYLTDIKKAHRPSNHVCFYRNCEINYEQNLIPFQYHQDISWCSCCNNRRA